MDTAALFLRITIAVVLFPHGAQLLPGWFGGPGYTGALEFLTNGMGLNTAIAFFIILLQFLAPVLLLTGIFSRWTAISVLGMFFGMLFYGHIENGFFMNWSGTQKGEGVEFHVLMIGAAITLTISGPGKCSLDHFLFFIKEKKS